jgi:ribosomal protein S1
MRKYYKYNDEENVICFLELDEELYCERAIYDIDGNFVSTNLTIEDEKYFLPEGSFIDCLESLTQTTQKEFLDIWNKVTFPHLKNWDKLKIELEIGQIINANILCFYPQGIILNIGQEFYAIADYGECKNKFGADKMHPNEKLEFTIGEFDNNNLWVKLKT